MSTTQATTAAGNQETATNRMSHNTCDDNEETTFNQHKTSLENFKESFNNTTNNSSGRLIFTDIFVCYLLSSAFNV